MPPRRRPTLRILLLAAFATVVYLKFDSFVSSKGFQTLRHPEKLWTSIMHHGKSVETLKQAPPTDPPKWSGDSGLVKVECPSSQIETCLQAWAELGSEVTGTLRGVLTKAALQLDKHPEMGFAAEFQKESEAGSRPSSLEPAMALTRLELRTPAGPFVLLQKSGKDGSKTYCAGKDCFDAMHPALPFGSYGKFESSHDRSSTLSLFPLGETLFHAILPGRIVSMTGGDAPKKSLKIYHGRNLYSSYGNYSGLKPGLQVGSQVNMRDTLGFVAKTGADSSSVLTLQIEKDGLLIDPLAFLGLGADTTGATDGR